MSFIYLFVRSSVVRSNDSAFLSCVLMIGVRSNAEDKLESITRQQKEPNYGFCFK